MGKDIIVSSIRPVRKASTSIRKYLEYVGTLLDIAGKRNSDIVCLPEDFAELRERAQSSTGSVGTFIMSFAKKYKMYIIMPISERYNEKNYASAILIDRNGIVAGRYFKIHSTPLEVKKFKISRGNTIPVFQTDFGTIGIMICFDSYFPELPAILARKGAKIIFFPHQQNTPDPDTYMLHIRAHAMFNSVYIVASTWGTKSGDSWDPRSCYPSCIIGQDGNIIASSQKEEGVVTATIDVDRKWMVNGHAEPGIKDMRWIYKKYRRPDLYIKEDSEWSKFIK